VPGKVFDQQPHIDGNSIPKSSKVHNKLQEIFHKSDNECDIPIAFSKSAEGLQDNGCRNEIIELLGNGNSDAVESGSKIAYRLQESTTNRSGLGLLFLVSGESNGEKKLLLSRFPADEGIVAQRGERGLKVELFEEVFLRNAHSYKAALYRGTSFEADF
jgi:hypothetical protein